jgi:hypothetical protein
MNYDSCGKCQDFENVQYPFLSLQNTVTQDENVFPHRVLFNTSEQEVAYSEGSVERPTTVFSSDI